MAARFIRAFASLLPICRLPLSAVISLCLCLPADRQGSKAVAVVPLQLPFIEFPNLNFEITPAVTSRPSVATHSGESDRGLTPSYRLSRTLCIPNMCNSVQAFAHPA
jgi:hypothetical protein